MFRRYNSSNPVFRNMDRFETGTMDVCTKSGVTNKTMILLLLAIMSGLTTVFMYNSGGDVLLGISPILFFVGLFGSIFTLNKIFPMLYAVGVGASLGLISFQYESFYEGIVGIAIVSTACIFFTMLFLYNTRIIRVTNKLRGMIVGAMLSYFLFTIVVMISSFFSDSLISMYTSSTGIGLALSVFVVLLGAFMLLLDFNNIERSVQYGVSSKYEWRLAFGLMVTIVWIYIEVLKLIAKLMQNMKD